MRRCVLCFACLLVGCVAPATESLDESAGDATSTADAATSESPADPSTDTGSSGGDPTTIGFIQDPDGGGFECSIWEEDCPVGEKCMPWANDGGNAWNAMTCSPVAPDADAVGEPCTVQDSGVSGVDSCQLHSMCWDVDPKTNQGVCVSFCTGSERNPSCPEPRQECQITGDSVLLLCLPDCSPLLQDCSEGQGCYGVDDSFVCAPDASGDEGAPGDPCGFYNGCEPGTACINAELVPNCPSDTACCSNLCDLGDANPACDIDGGQQCTSWFEEGAAPPGYENVGVCAVPESI